MFNGERGNIQLLAEILARSGVGRITLADRDYVEWSNLQRQQLFCEDDAIHRIPKAIAAKTRLAQINSEIEINGVVADVSCQEIESLCENVDLIIDATDNFDTRFSKREGIVARNAYLLSIQLEDRRLIIFEDGRALVQGTQDLVEAKRLYHRYLRKGYEI
ncbi:molybdopterin/thiamine biosynthesis adenylyltransferase [Paenibacillus castaneae]|nr:ThiF family adenylyltransferase [Paenibacillus castaneae]NIK75163.1 molybdopterin/thiamine biosynthesis adenylyltransferase [Paenibacillus castaneae]